MAPSMYHAVVAAAKWRSIDLDPLKERTSVVFRERIGIDFLLGPDFGVIVHQDKENINEQLMKCHKKRPSMKITVISSTYPVNLQLLCDELGYKVIPSFGIQIGQLLSFLLRPKKA
ncbi:uncharacterized protein LOC100899387 [Galendromus occidentalis]|uniref:Uncharacterized protein LOC100899387 n=1 Tax=Galendromus occidentalis TaxID=34638 RepID=A0AAJ6QMH9_9ACAR|nr:uncharacterized protein LOC100899387 [Galendromus occidentalis]